MKFIAVTILSICLVAATFSQWLLIACYEVNENYIAKEFCVNKNDPHSHCNGHCYLSKQLDKEERQSNPLGSASKEKFEVQLFCIEAFTHKDNIVLAKTNSYSAVQNFSLQQVAKTSFHPPCAV